MAGFVRFDATSQDVFPGWAAEELMAHTLVPGGSKVDPASLPIAPVGTARKRLESGNVVFRTLAQRDSGAAFSLVVPATVLGATDQVAIVAFELSDALLSNDITLVRQQTMIYENKLPQWAALTAAQRAAVQSRYQCRTAAAAI